MGEAVRDIEDPSAALVTIIHNQKLLQKQSDC